MGLAPPPVIFGADQDEAEHKFVLREDGYNGKGYHHNHEHQCETGFASHASLLQMKYLGTF
jgi:hypothetical protein